MDKSKQNQQGFSLVELAVVMVVSGIIFAAGVTAYGNYLEKNKIYDTQDKIESINKAMDRFFAKYGRYPCPASATATGSATGIESNCLDMSVAVDSCGTENSSIRIPNGSPAGFRTENVDFTYCVSEDVVDKDGPVGPTASENFRIRKGIIPYKTLSIGTHVPGDDEKDFYEHTTDFNLEDAQDAHGNYFTYALTENQGTVDFLPRIGAIRVLDENNVAVSENQLENHADFVIVSHGRADSGAFSLSGNMNGACNNTLPNFEEQNCDNNSTYVSSLLNDSGPGQTDDYVHYRNWAHYFLWNIATPTPGNPDNDDNIYNENTGNVGIGVFNPQQRLHVMDGNLVTDQNAHVFNKGLDGDGKIIRDADGEPVAKTSVKAVKLCGENIKTAADWKWDDCFNPEMLGGGTLGDWDLAATAADKAFASTQGIECDDPTNNLNNSAAEFKPGVMAIRKFAANKVSCEKFYDAQETAKCDPVAGVKEFVTGFTYNLGSKELTADCEPY